MAKDFEGGVDSGVGYGAARDIDDDMAATTVKTKGKRPFPLGAFELHPAAVPPLLGSDYQGKEQSLIDAALTAQRLDEDPFLPK
jgi:hypothetical protein